MDTTQTHEALLRAFCQLGHHSTCITVPALVWQTLGNDAILIGFNQAMVELTDGGIETALGTTISEFSCEASRRLLFESVRTGAPVAFEIVRKLRTGPGVYLMATAFCPGADGRVVMRTIPLARLDAEREREGRIGEFRQ